MRRSSTVAVTAAALATALVTAACGGSSAGPLSEADSTGISTSGVGTVTATPDTATVELGVETSAPTAAEALAQNAALAEELIEGLTEAGVDRGDVRTSELSVSPHEDPDGRIIDYRVTNRVTATLDDIDRAGALIDGAAAAAGDAIRVRSLSFSISDDSALRAQARADAVAQAKAQAEQLADAAGVKLGKVREIVESPGAMPLTQRGVMADVAAATPIEPGTADLTVTVSVVYDIA